MFVSWDFRILVPEHASYLEAWISEKVFEGHRFFTYPSLVLPGFSFSAGHSTFLLPFYIDVPETGGSSWSW